MTQAALKPDSDEDERRRLGDRLREARKYLGLKQEEVATYLKIPRTALTDIENGQRRVESVVAGAGAAGWAAARDSRRGFSRGREGDRFFSCLTDASSLRDGTVSIVFLKYAAMLRPACVTGCWSPLNSRALLRISSKSSAYS